MGFRYRKSIKLAPGLKLNLNTKSTSVTVGGKHFRKTYNSKNNTVTTSASTPIKGLYYTDTKKMNKSQPARSAKPGKAASARAGATKSKAAVEKPVRYKEKGRFWKWFAGFWIVVAIAARDPFGYAMVFGGFLMWYGYQYYKANRRYTPEQLERLAFFVYPSSQRYTSVMVFRKARKLKDKLAFQLAELENQIGQSINGDFGRLLDLLAERNDMYIRYQGIRSIEAEPDMLPMEIDNYRVDMIREAVEARYRMACMDADELAGKEERQRRYESFFNEMDAYSEQLPEEIRSQIAAWKNECMEGAY